MSDPVRVSVIVVNYRTCDLTLACLASLYRETTRVTFEVIVVDNASGDGSADRIAEEFPQATLIRSEENLGFARANNLAAERASGRRLLLLNPDTVVLDHAIDRIVEYADETPGARVWGGRTVFEDGSLNPTSCWGAPSPWAWLSRGLGLAKIFSGSRAFDPEPMRWWDRTSEREVAVITGCFLLIDRDLWNDLGGFDRDFIMYGEDIDLCLRAAKRGARPRVCPQACIVHYGGKSERIKEDQLIRQFAAKTLLARKHWTGARRTIGRLSIGAWGLNRLAETTVLGVVDSKKRAERDIWRKVWKRRGEWL
ncbi:MAG: glycosyltransferase family 2 protein [Phycisphaerales bacterium]